MALCSCGGAFDFYPRSPCGERPLQYEYYNSMRKYFYPRSPCGERRLLHGSESKGIKISIHALLAESDDFFGFMAKLLSIISIHALLAESDRQVIQTCRAILVFLSTLSLRRATSIVDIINNIINDFYPRSPCGERRQLPAPKPPIMI